MRKAYTAENMAVARHIVLNISKNYPTPPNEPFPQTSKM